METSLVTLQTQEYFTKKEEYFTKKETSLQMLSYEFSKIFQITDSIDYSCETGSVEITHFFTPHYDTSEGYIRTRKIVINSSGVLRADAEKICTKKKFSIKYPFRKYDRIRRKYLVTFTEEILNGKLHFLSNGT